MSLAEHTRITKLLLAPLAMAASVACTGVTSTGPSPDPSTEQKGEEEPGPQSPTSCGGTSAAGARVSDGTFRTADEARTLTVDRATGIVTRSFVDAEGKKVVERWKVR